MKKTLESIVISIVVLVVLITVFPKIMLIAGIVLVLLLAGFGYLLYKNPEFREKTTTFFLNVFKGKKENVKIRIPIPEDIKIKVFDRAGHKCQKCGSDTSLKIHHIDGNPSNNSLNNLIALCPTHHDEADKGVIRKESLKSLMAKQATKTQTVYTVAK